jgi:hypothetical protein
LRDRKRELETTLKKVEQGLKALGQKRKSKKAAKRKTARRAATR